MALKNRISQDLYNSLKAAEDELLCSNPDRETQKAILRIVEIIKKDALDEYCVLLMVAWSKKSVRAVLGKILDVVIPNLIDAAHKNFAKSTPENSIEFDTLNVIAGKFSEVMRKLDDGEYNDILSENWLLY